MDEKFVIYGFEFREGNFFLLLMLRENAEESI